MPPPPALVSWVYGYKGRSRPSFHLILATIPRDRKSKHFTTMARKRKVRLKDGTLPMVSQVLPFSSRCPSAILHTGRPGSLQPQPAALVTFLHCHANPRGPFDRSLSLECHLALCRIVAGVGGGGWGPCFCCWLLTGEAR